MSRSALAVSISAVTASDMGSLAKMLDFGSQVTAGATGGLCMKYSQEMALASAANAAAMVQGYHEVIHSPITQQNVAQVAASYQKAGMQPPQYFTSNVNNAAWSFCCQPSALTQIFGMDGQSQSNKEFCVNGATMMAPNALPADTPRTFTVFQLAERARDSSLVGYSNQVLQQCMDYAIPVQDVSNSLFPGFVNTKATKYMWACEGNDIGIEIGNSGVNVGVQQSKPKKFVDKDGNHVWGSGPKRAHSDFCNSQGKAKRHCRKCTPGLMAIGALSGSANKDCHTSIHTGVEVPGIGLLGSAGPGKDECDKDSCCHFDCEGGLNVNFNPLAASSTMNAIGATPFGKLFGRELDDEHKEAAETPIVV